MDARDKRGQGDGGCFDLIGMHPKSPQPASARGLMGFPNLSGTYPT